MRETLDSAVNRSDNERIVVTLDAAPVAQPQRMPA
jgi:hypothetical protein